MMADTMEPIEKLAEWAGIKVLGKSQAGLWGELDMTGFAVYLNEVGARRLCDFTSLDACFEHLEPPLRERLGIYHIGFGRAEGVAFTCYMYRKAVEWPYRHEGRSKELSTIGSGPTLGAAFCDAAWQAINKYPELEKQGDFIERNRTE